MTAVTQTTHILKALLVGFPKSAVNPMFGPEAEAVEIIKAKKSHKFLSKNYILLQFMSRSVSFSMD
jgi:hypothetical protein